MSNQTSQLKDTQMTERNQIALRVVGALLLGYAPQIFAVFGAYLIGKGLVDIIANPQAQWAHTACPLYFALGAFFLYPSGTKK
jgi:hypothetical protein